MDIFTSCKTTHYNSYMKMISKQWDKMIACKLTFDGDCSIRVYRFFICMNTMLGNYYSVDIILNALPSS